LSFDSKRDDDATGGAPNGAAEPNGARAGGLTADRASPPEANEAPAGGITADRASQSERNGAPAPGRGADRARPSGHIAAARHAGASGYRTTKSELTRERILEAAAVTFRERGFAATRLADIAARAGLQTPSLYYHFASKEELIEVVLSLGVERTFAHVKASVAATGEDPVARLEAAIRAHVEMVLKTGNYSAANLRLYGQMPDDIRRRLQRRQQSVGRYWNELLRDARDAGAIRADLDLSALRMLILGMLNWTAEWFRPGSLTARQLADQATLVVLDGIAVGGRR
jgi:AcrR family transcriptional regulator